MDCRQCDCPTECHDREGFDDWGWCRCDQGISLIKHDQDTVEADKMQSVPPYSVAVGNPARVIRQAPTGTDAARTSGAIAALERDEAAGKGGE